jgi:hypothetical protein
MVLHRRQPCSDEHRFVARVGVNAGHASGHHLSKYFFEFLEAANFIVYQSLAAVVNGSFARPYRTTEDLHPSHGGADHRPL